MVVANNEIDETKNASKSSTILMAMAMQRYDAGRIASLYAAIGRVPAPYRPDGRHGNEFEFNTQNTNKTQLLPSDNRFFLLPYTVRTTGD
jgi:hypothetical protein